LAQRKLPANYDKGNHFEQAKETAALHLEKKHLQKKHLKSKETATLP
jgi:hypothetical protein